MVLQRNPMTDPRDVVRAQYEDWVYPLPVDDLSDRFQRGLYDLADPSLVRRKLWPRNVEPDALDILVAGCGSTQAAIIALANPACRVIGIDISGPSLDHQRFLKDKYELGNLEVQQLPVEQAPELARSFDLVVSTGVLHHLPDPDKGLRSLRDVLAPHGVMTLMVYGQYARTGVYMVQELLRLFGAEQDAEGVELVRYVLDAVPDWHVVLAYTNKATDLEYDAGLVDTFLHRQDRAYTVPQVLEFAETNGLKFQAWLDNLNYAVSAYVGDDNEELMERAALLPKEAQWSFVELFNQVHGTHRFLLCHADRPESDYTLDFESEAWRHYVPSLRPPIDVVVRQGFTSTSLSNDPDSGTVSLERGGHIVELDSFGAAVVDLVDGVTPIGDILRQTSEMGIYAGDDAEESARNERRFFEQMADWDHFQFEIPR